MGILSRSPTSPPSISLNLSFNPPSIAYVIFYHQNSICLGSLVSSDTQHHLNSESLPGSSEVSLTVSKLTNILKVIKWKNPRALPVCFPLLNVHWKLLLASSVLKIMISYYLFPWFYKNLYMNIYSSFIHNLK